ncbi:hypothetical protein [Nonomuraea rubra]
MGINSRPDVCTWSCAYYSVAILVPDAIGILETSTCRRPAS